MNILIIDDAEDSRNELRDALAQAGESITATDDAGFASFLNPEPDVIVTDLIMPDSDGLAVIRHLHENKIQAQIVFVSTAHQKVLESAERFALALGLNVAGVLRKPVKSSDLADLILRKKTNQSEAAETPFLESEIVDLIEQGAIVPAFQVQMDIKTRKIVAAESLARLYHAASGKYIFPDEFIGIAMRNGLMPIVTNTIWDQTVEMATECKRLGRPLNFSINLTLDDFADGTLPSRLISSLEKTGLPAESFTIEITETVVYQNDLTMLEALTRLRMRGFKLSIDDFGTGFSSMRQLIDLPFSELKIDKDFVFNCKKREARAVVETSVALARKMGMTSVAEGVESDDVMEYLKWLGCDLAQGYLIAKPLFRDDFLYKVTR